mgnify:FL=1
MLMIWTRASSFEITQLRKKFYKRMKQTKGIVFSGWAMWKKQKTKRQFIVATHIKKFPILQMSCSLEKPSSCQIERKCNTSFPKGFDRASIRGIIYSKAANEFLIGDTKSHRILRFSAGSCWRFSYKGSIELPKKIEGLNNIFLDEDENLWVATNKPDNYYNASVYFWKPEQWSPGIKTLHPPKSENSP